MPGIIGDLQKDAEKNGKAEGENTFMDMINSASKQINENFKNYKKLIAPGFVMINPLYVEL